MQIPIRFWIYLALIVASGLGAWHYKSTLDENKRLDGELKTANGTVAALDEAATRNETIRTNERNDLDELENTPDSDDGPIAPVLKRTIDRLQ